MRAPHLYPLLRGFVLGSFVVLGRELEEGSDLPFAFEEHVQRGGPALYELRPLVRAFIEERETILRRREDARLALVELGPGAIVPEHRHEHEQLGMCIEGAITFTIDGERRELGPGGTWRIPSNLPHDAVAGRDGAVVVDIFSPVRADWDALPRSEPRSPR